MEAQTVLELLADQKAAGCVGTVKVMQRRSLHCSTYLPWPLPGNSQDRGPKETDSKDLESKSPSTHWHADATLDPWGTAGRGCGCDATFSSCSCTGTSP